MKKMPKIFVPAFVLGAAMITFGVYWHHNLHWYDEYEKNLNQAGAVEKQFTSSGGNIINYGEIENRILQRSIQIGIVRPDEGRVI